MIDIKFIDELFEEREGRCPHIKRDLGGRPYCGKDLAEGAEPNEVRRMVCDVYSLQLWCLDGVRYDKCIFYQGESLGDK